MILWILPWSLFKKLAYKLFLLLLILIRFTIFYLIKIKFYDFLIFLLSNLSLVSPKNSMYEINTKQKHFFL